MICRNCGSAVPFRSMLFSLGYSALDVRCPGCKAYLRPGRKTRWRVLAGLFLGGLITGAAGYVAGDILGWDLFFVIGLFVISAAAAGTLVLVCAWLGDDYAIDDPIYMKHVAYWKLLLGIIGLAALSVGVTVWWSGEAREARNLAETGVQTTCVVHTIEARSGGGLELVSYYVILRCPALPAPGDLEREIGFIEYWKTSAGDETLYYYDPAQPAGGVTALELPLMSEWRMTVMWSLLFLSILCAVWLMYWMFREKKSGTV